MSLGFILLIAAGVLILFGAGQRVLDRLRLTDRQAILFIALIIAGGFVPDIWLSENFAFNLGGAVVPLILCVYLWVKADTFLEKARSVAAALLTAVAVYVGIKCSRILELQVVGIPFVNILSLMATGTPAKGEVRV